MDESLKKQLKRDCVRMGGMVQYIWYCTIFILYLREARVLVNTPTYLLCVHFFSFVGTLRDVWYHKHVSFGTKIT